MKSIHVKAQDGQTVTLNFPDETPQAVIDEAVRRDFGVGEAPRREEPAPRIGAPVQMSRPVEEQQYNRFPEQFLRRDTEPSLEAPRPDQAEHDAGWQEFYKRKDQSVNEPLVYALQYPELIAASWGMGVGKSTTPRLAQEPGSRSVNMAERTTEPPPERRLPPVRGMTGRVSQPEPTDLRVVAPEPKPEPEPAREPGIEEAARKVGLPDWLIAASSPAELGAIIAKAKPVEAVEPEPAKRGPVQPNATDGTEVPAGRAEAPALALPRFTRAETDAAGVTGPKASTDREGMAVRFVPDVAEMRKALRAEPGGEGTFEGTVVRAAPEGTTIRLADGTEQTVPTDQVVPIQKKAVIPPEAKVEPFALARTPEGKVVRRAKQTEIKRK